MATVVLLACGRARSESTSPTVLSVCSPPFTPLCALGLTLGEHHWASWPSGYQSSSTRGSTGRRSEEGQEHGVRVWLPLPAASSRVTAPGPGRPGPLLNLDPAAVYEACFPLLKLRKMPTQPLPRAARQVSQPSLAQPDSSQALPVALLLENVLQLPKCYTSNWLSSSGRP